jgi:putative DNA primase/helicase
MSDFSDFESHFHLDSRSSDGNGRGSDANVMRMHTISDAYRTDGDAPEQGSNSHTGEQRADRNGVALQCASTVEPLPIRWLWNSYLANGKMHILGGAPSAGKTTLALSLAAIVSSGGSFPDGSRAVPGNVVIWSGEDDFADTIVPRLMAAGADLGRVHFVDCVREVGRPRPFDPAKDMPSLGAAIKKLGGASVLIVDPIVSAIAGDGHKNNDVRRGLQPLVDMIKQHDIAAIGITHFSKGTAGRDPAERITGSVAFGALARIVLVAAKESQDGEQEGDDAPIDRRVLTRAKANICADGGGFSYSVASVELPGGMVTTRVNWGEQLTGTAREILGSAESDDTGDDAGSALSEAREFLKVELAAGQVAVKELYRRAKDAGVKDRTLQRAMQKLRVQKEKVGAGKEASWLASLPGE